ncbi:hypothetical protein BH11VER1_BH11VER1_13600 [soil metagenome]
MNDREIFGASATVVIRFDGSMQALANKLSTVLNIGTFQVEPSEHPPHMDIGSAEALGWELWLEAGNTSGEFNLRGETEHAVAEVFHGRMHDLSPWLARFLTMMCDLTVTPATPNSAHPSPPRS